VADSAAKVEKFGGVENRRESRRDEKALFKSIVTRVALLALQFHRVPPTR
jgi:hypothetical protein